MAKQYAKKSAASGTKREGSVAVGQEEMIKKDQQAIERLVAQSLARRFPLYEAGRNVVGFLSILGSKHLTERIINLFRSHNRQTQNLIADSIRIYVLWQSIDLLGIGDIDNELQKIFDEYDERMTM
jgi:hypothetical protein